LNPAGVPLYPVEMIRSPVGPDPWTMTAPTLLPQQFAPSRFGVSSDSDPLTASATDM
jgi:hypothetical protein